MKYSLIQRLRDKAEDNFINGKLTKEQYLNFEDEVLQLINISKICSN